ncbi:MAG: type II toxin-antitoxin system VapC family toxin [Burkholderiales bacterium]
MLDTCTFLWLIGNSPRLPESARTVLTSPDHDAFLSVASLWEILLKHALGRFDMHVREAPDRYFVSRREAHGVASLPIDEEAVAQLPKLPDLHRDPFDRILVCQAIAHGLTIVTPDEAIRRYPVRSFW